MTPPAWVLPALGFVLANGLLGIAIKLALRHVTLGDVVAWTCLVYLALGAVVLLSGSGSLPSGLGGGYAALVGVCAAAGLVFSVLALKTGKASEAVPFMAGYPIVTVVVAIAVLSERLSAQQAAGIALVMLGLVVLSS